MACVMSAPRSVSATLSGWRTRLKHALERKRATVVKERGREGGMRQRSEGGKGVQGKGKGGRRRGRRRKGD